MLSLAREAATLLGREGMLAGSRICRRAPGGEDGLAREHWGVFDMMSLMQQLGVAPGAPA